MQSLKLLLQPFSVTVVSGQTVTKTFSVTRIINDDQIRFVLRWGDEESDAPSDLDSHLVVQKQAEMVNSIPIIRIRHMEIQTHRRIM